MTIKHLFPVAKPSLDLNFAATRKLDPRITFSRSSTGTYVDANGIIRTAAEDEPRFDYDPETGESLGLLIEESRTNEIYNSNAKVYQTGQPFTSTGNIWQSCSNPSQGIITNISTTSEVGPDGLSGVTKVAPEAGISYDLVDFTPNDGFQMGFTYTGNLKAITGFFKPSGCDILNVRWGNYSTARAVYTFNASTLVVTGSDASIVALANGWFKFQITNSARQSLTFGCSKSNGDPNNGVDGVLFWGVQSEDNVSFPTSYIPTSGSTATRAADICSIEGDNFSSWYNQGEGSFFLHERNSYGVATAIRFELNQNISPNSNAISFNVNYGNGVRIESRDSDAKGSIDRTLPNVWTSGGSHKYAYGLKENNFSVVSGVNSATDTSGTFPPNLDSLSFGANARATVMANKCGKVSISRLAYYPRRLSDEQLQALTA